MYTTSDPKEFSIAKRIRSFRFAFNGIISFFREEHNAWIHLFATIVVILLTLIIPCSNTEIILLVFAMAFVWVAEIFNTSIERLADLYSRQQDPKIELIKDLSAASVLIAASSAFITGCIIFIPKIF